LSSPNSGAGGLGETSPLDDNAVTARSSIVNLGLAGVEGLVGSQGNANMFHPFPVERIKANGLSRFPQMANEK
jgi:hypothetical protein